MARLRLDFSSLSSIKNQATSAASRQNTAAIDIKVLNICAQECLIT